MTATLTGILPAVEHAREFLKTKSAEKLSIKVIQYNVAFAK